MNSKLDKESRYKTLLEFMQVLKQTLQELLEEDDDDDDFLDFELVGDYFEFPDLSNKLIDNPEPIKFSGYFMIGIPLFIIIALTKIIPELGILVLIVFYFPYNHLISYHYNNIFSHRKFLYPYLGDFYDIKDKLYVTLQQKGYTVTYHTPNVLTIKDIKGKYTYRIVLSEDYHITITPTSKEKKVKYLYHFFKFSKYYGILVYYIQHINYF